MRHDIMMSPCKPRLTLLLFPTLFLHYSPTDSFSACSQYTSCNDCSSLLSHCHWCSHDNACHAKGSLSGCTIGASCTATPSCLDHNTCQECSASWGCHWCSFDEACHAVGSLHGCATGVNCYAIDRCQRLEPEKVQTYGGIFSKATFQGVGPVMVGLVAVLFGLTLCCASMCLTGVALVKCALQDLVDMPTQMVEDDQEMYYQRIENEMAQQHLPQQQQQLEDDSEEDEHHNLEIALLQNAPYSEEEMEQYNDTDNSNYRNNNSLELMGPEQVSVTQLSRLSSPTMYLPPPPKGKSQVARMYCACQLCYILTIFTTIILSLLALSYAPRHPQYNVCTDQFAWKSIVEGMASLKMNASFDLLISVYNPNRWEVDLSNGAGQFHHDGEYVGSFTIPSTRISPQAISDMVLKVTFTPDKWSALSLTSEYYRGTLKFIVGGHSFVKIPGLGNYQFDAKFDNIEVNVNDPSLDDTHLCACPGWEKP